MYFTDDEWLGFASGLRRATDAGRLEWSFEDPWNETVFVATVPGNATYALYSRDGDAEFPYVLEIKEVDGTKLAEFTTVSYEEDIWEQTPDKIASGVIDGLYRHVSRLVTGAPQRAQSLLHGLGKLAPQEPPSPEGDPF